MSGSLRSTTPPVVKRRRRESPHPATKRSRRTPPPLPCRWQDHGFIYIARGVRCGNIFASGAHVYTYGDPSFYYEADEPAVALA